MLDGRATLLLMLVACLSSFGWALKKHFICHQLTLFMRLTAAVGLMVAMLQVMAILLASRVRTTQFAIGIVLYAASFAIFWWTINITRARRLSVAFSTDEPRQLLMTGPFRFVRHPFYASYSLFWIAGFIAVPRWYVLPGTAAMLMFYFSAARMEEAKFANSALSESYEYYRSRTGMFLPRFRKIWNTEETSGSL